MKGVVGTVAEVEATCFAGWAVHFIGPELRHCHPHPHKQTVSSWQGQRAKETKSAASFDTGTHSFASSQGSCTSPNHVN